MVGNVGIIEGAVLLELKFLTSRSTSPKNEDITPKIVAVRCTLWYFTTCPNLVSFGVTGCFGQYELLTNTSHVIHVIHVIQSKGTRIHVTNVKSQLFFRTTLVDETREISHLLCTIPVILPYV